MKHTISLFVIMVFAISAIFAKDNQHAQKAATVKGDDFSIIYGRPSKDGKVIFGDKQSNAVIHYGSVWRAGTDEQPAEITIDKDCLFAGHPLKAGTYTMFITFYPMEWVVTLNSKLGQTGPFSYEAVKDKNAVYAALGGKHNDKVVETFTITAQNDGFLVEWDQVSGFISVTPVGK